MTLRIDPIAVTRGQSVEIAVSGRENFGGAWALLCESSGLHGQVVKVVADEPKARPRSGRGRATGQVLARLEVDARAPLGPREIRVATPQGASSVGLVLVVDHPVVAELDDQANDRPAGAQSLSLPSVIAGRIGKLEDVDWYRLELTKGQRVTFEVWGNRLENKMHDLQTHIDPILSLHDQAGRELAAADNTHFADPLLSYQAPAAGTYYLQVRDTTYAGNPAWSYALQAVSGPVATSAFPVAVNPGTTATLDLEGPGLEPAAVHTTLSIPNNEQPGVHLFAIPGKDGGALPVSLVVSSLPVERELKDAPETGNPEQPVSLPRALCGRLGQRGDRDGFRFAAKKGVIYAFELVARRAGSECDPLLRILDPKGSIVAEEDDTRGMGKDARLEWKAAGDGVYTVQVADLHDRGGPAMSYVLLAEAARPDFTLVCDPDLLNVGPGGRVPLFIRLTRRQGFGGAVRLSWDQLPAGITASPLEIPPAMTEGVIVVSAAKDSKQVASLVSLKGIGQGRDGPIEALVRPQEEIYLPGGGRGHYPVDTLALALTAPSDITVEATPSELVLAPGASAALDVTVTRHPRYEQPVNLAVVLQHLGGVHGNPLPPGVTVKEGGSKTLLGPKESKGKIILQAAPGAAPCEKVPIAVMGHVSINFVVKTAYASAPILVSVRPGTGSAADGGH
jgi:hypothetical protein